MMMGNKILRRVLILLLASFFLAAPGRPAAGESYVRTPADYEGPFYPVTDQQDEDNDLIHVTGRTEAAGGDILNLSGVITNTAGQPRAGITIEIWQTDPQGRYKHPGDSTPGERNPNFQYWGRATTGADGTFFFKTLVPGSYQPRPAHIHYKVWQNGRVILTSQIYFGNFAEKNERSSMTTNIALQTVDLKPAAKGEFEAFFRIVL